MNKYDPNHCLTCNACIPFYRTKRAIEVEVHPSTGPTYWTRMGYSCDNDECEREAKDKFLEVKQ